MHIKLDPLDLRPEYRNETDPLISAYQVTFDTLTDQVQAIVKIAGHAIYHSWDGQTYQKIYAPVSVSSAVLGAARRALREGLEK